MSTFIPQWMQGQNVLLSMTPQTVDPVTGALTAGTTVNFPGVLVDDGFSSRTTFTTTPISPMDCGQENDVDVMQSTTYQVAELMQSGTASSATSNKLDHIARLCRYVSVVISCVNNSAAVVRTEAALCKWNEYNPTWRKQDAKGLMTLKTVAVGNSAGGFEANPVLAD